MRCVYFVDKHVVDDMSRKRYDRYYAVTKGISEYNGRSPLSPSDFVEYLSKNQRMLRYAVVECDTDGDVGNSFLDSEIVAVYDPIMTGLYLPVVSSSKYQLFSKPTDIYIEDVGWEHPAPNISLTENRRCMSYLAYTEMINKIIAEFGHDCFVLVDAFDCDMILSERLINELCL